MIGMGKKNLEDGGGFRVADSDGRRAPGRRRIREKVGGRKRVPTRSQEEISAATVGRLCLISTYHIQRSHSTLTSNSNGIRQFRHQGFDHWKQIWC
jgi:hypothetical protein